jgi:DNA mismatch repair ATPase MutS
MRVTDAWEKAGVPDGTALVLAPLLCYYRVARFVRAETATITELYALVGALDVALGVASFRESLPYHAQPEYIETRRLAASGVYHPLLSVAVPNSIDVAGGVLVTGSNASGKSTFLKTIAVNLILGQAINTCCARAMHMRRANVVTAMAVSDNIVEGDSYFIAEIKAMKRLVAAAGQEGFCYFFIDEILRGTNTVERIAAACAFLRYFDLPGVICFAASHDIELVHMTSPAYMQVHFAEDIVDGEVAFSFKLLEGPP